MNGFVIGGLVLAIVVGLAQPAAGFMVYLLVCAIGAAFWRGKT